MPLSNNSSPLSLLINDWLPTGVQIVYGSSNSAYLVKNIEPIDVSTTTEYLLNIANTKIEIKNILHVCQATNLVHAPKQFSKDFCMHSVMLVILCRDYLMWFKLIYNFIWD